jgi:molybdopterin synthase catalytic subunit
VFLIAREPIDTAAFGREVEDPAAGAFASFVGKVRNHADGRRVQSLVYEAYDTLAEKEGERILEEARSSFAILAAACVHRAGHLAIGDVAVWVGVSAAHRADAFAACRYIIDEVKHRVPIWKKEFYAVGDSVWVESSVLDPEPVLQR